MIVHVDTHNVVYMHACPDRLLPAAPHLVGNEVRLSPMARLELQYLFEIGRLTLPAESILSDLNTSVGLRVAWDGWNSATRIALDLHWTRDPFDRLIAAHALAESVPLVSSDTRIRKHLPNAVWD